MSTPQATQALHDELNRLRLELQTYKVQDNSEQIYVGAYLLQRLAQLGVTHMFGLPGDFNLGFLDLVEDHPSIEWVGNCNELNAAYAADGYARVNHHSIGVLLTTFGVGELSAMNGIAGAFSEMVPILHIAGVPNTDQQAAKPMLHHTLGDGRYDAYYKASEQFSVAQGSIMSTSNAASEIDRLLSECITKARPVYMTLPTNLVYQKISSERLKTPLSRLPSPNSPATEAFVIEQIVGLVEKAKDDVIILVDACAIRHDALGELEELVQKTGFPVYSAPMGKTAINENYERFGGIYVGSISQPEIRAKVESAKLILSVGALKSDFNTGNFTYSIPIERTIEFHSDHTLVQYAKYPALGMKELLPKLSPHLARFRQTSLTAFTPFSSPVPVEKDEVISQAWFWPKMGEFFEPKDVIVTETGTSNFGILPVKLPAQSVLVNQILWGSIGWSVGSTLGAALAARAKGFNRTILFVGDGSIQLTVQELSVMARLGVKPIIFLLNNSGYTIERYLHGKTRKYNDISNWKWTSLFSVLGDADLTLSRSYTVHNKTELSALLLDKQFSSADKIQLVEVMMDKFDAPAALKDQAELSGKTNAYAI